MQEITHIVAGYIRAGVFEHGPQIAIILLGAYILQRSSGYFVGKIIRKFIQQGRGSKIAEEKREHTLTQVVSGTSIIVIWIVAGLMILSEVGVEIGPLLAAAGIVGIAVGFGGQYLIRDVITGLFILLENQYRVGDVVCLGDTCGSVEQISLRMTMLRDLDGTVHHIPHGEITKVANLTKDFAQVNLNVRVSYDANIDHVIAVINRVGEALAADESWKEQILQAPAFLRVNEFTDSAMVIKILGKTEPLMQWSVTGELRKRLKNAFDAEGIVIPYPQYVVRSRGEG